MKKIAVHSKPVKECFFCGKPVVREYSVQAMFRCISSDSPFFLLWLWIVQLDVVFSQGYEHVEIVPDHSTVI